MVIKRGVTLSAMNIISYEFFEYAGDGVVVYDLVDEGDNVNCVEYL